MKRRQTLLPPTDEELAAAERTQFKRDNDALAAREDEQKQIRLAATGDPDAIAALATALKGRPVENEGQDSKSNDQRSTRSRVNDIGRGRSTATRTNARTTARRPAKPARSAPPPDGEADEAPPPIRTLPADEEDAYTLMDLTCRKWKSAALKDVRKADRELARDLLGDAAIYVKTGTMRLSDILDAKIKLSALGRIAEEEKGGGDMEEKLNDLRKALRGE